MEIPPKEAIDHGVPVKSTDIDRDQWEARSSLGILDLLKTKLIGGRSSFDTSQRSSLGKDQGISTISGIPE